MEVLLESGANAFLAGFTLEACATFSAALERFYEFALRVIALARGVSEETFQGMFAEMARQSERPLGAFIILYGIEFGEPYRPDKDITEFRNKVIHKGAIPTREEATKFCGAVYGRIFELYRNLSGRFGEQIHQVVRQDLRAKAKTVKGIARGTSCSAMFFKIANANNPETFAAALEEYKKAEVLINGAIPQLQALSELIKTQSK